ncbi:hypothetical protein CNECB9_2540087 [Cupriavidus necator]|uniref:Uncharacterized protein n=1 Tax=Cupriavidus necator TaxID=106590 RepID=A0A1K0IF73_CUPNE|nr:hypothetical protein CNECB9_2540087 [Cupriavidus necator]
MFFHDEWHVWQKTIIQVPILGLFCKGSPRQAIEVIQFHVGSQIRTVSDKDDLNLLAIGPLPRGLIHEEAHQPQLTLRMQVSLRFLKAGYCRLDVR